MDRAPILRSLFSAAVNLGAFAVAVMAVCAVLNASQPSLYVWGLSDKLAYLRDHPGEIDTVFVGSSRVLHAFDPAQFDGEMKSHGQEVHSYNLGINGMRPPESFYVLREVLKLHLPLRWVFIELVDLYPTVNAANLGSARYVHWHDLLHTKLILQRVLSSNAPLGEKVAQISVHAGCFLARLSNIGGGTRLLGDRLLGPQKKRPPEVSWNPATGYEAQLEPQLLGARRASYEQAVAALQKSPLPQKALPPLLSSALRDLLSEVRAAGAQPVFVISPTVQRAENLADLAAVQIDVPLIAFTDPLRHPGVFDPANHCDEEHLNAKGGAEYSHALAEEFADLTKPKLRATEKNH